MPDTPQVANRAQKKMHQKMQGGTIISFTTIMHPPKGFGNRPRTIGLIELNDGTRVLGELMVWYRDGQGRAGSDRIRQGIPFIGHKVKPHLRLSRVNEQGLRIYEVCYETLAEKPVGTRKEFPGYILALTGPSGVGKTTVSRLLTTKIGEYAEQVPILTTRTPSDHDEGEYEYIARKQFDALKKQGKLAAATRIASTSEQRWYGYRSSDIEAIWKKGKVPIVITEMGLLQKLAGTFGRRSILSFGLLPPGKSKRMMLSCLLHRLRIRGRDTEAAIKERLQNAEKDLQFFKDMAHLFDDLIINDDLDVVTKALKRHVLEVVRS